ncbi:nucleotide pyrophosphohydrolase [Microbulbifer sp. OS29]|uniref:Nucleotide pyrophosphohydrolase n=1 Tax=Microbulbifer okhotskensis TaxID=2926617 RepID=A0A9X2J639_9GAMM|nr:nucleotide pyrophosphohydrolase [Microbulbifer okhotskensis]MCO1335863.1 nucleotide pyrophosphohydrolase [Microbulbifer okhotskensis]
MKTPEILQAFDEIAEARGWQSLHTPKNLTMALAVEVAELSRHFQWREDGEIRALMAGENSEQVAAELADIQMYLSKLTAVLGVDMDAALHRKIAENHHRCAAALLDEGADER